MHRPRKHTLFLFVLQKVGAYTNSPFRQRHRTGLQSPPPVLPSLAPAELGLPWLPGALPCSFESPKKTNSMAMELSALRRTTEGSTTLDYSSSSDDASETMLGERASKHLAAVLADADRFVHCTHDPSRMCQTVALANSQLTFRRDLYHTLQGRQSG